MCILRFIYNPYVLYNHKFNSFTKYSIYDCGLVKQIFSIRLVVLWFCYSKSLHSYKDKLNSENCFYSINLLLVLSKTGHQDSFSEHNGL